jgi:GT2 family glycosyltransferase
MTDLASSGPAPQAAKPSLQIQSVLYNNSAQGIDRFLASLAQAVRHSRAHGDVGAVHLALGDCSSLPRLDEGSLGDLEAALAEAGISSLSYTFFHANLGSAAGHNALMASSGSDLLLIVNPDVVCSPYVISELLLPLADALVGVVEARQIPVEHPKPFDGATGTTPWVTTACALFRREVVDKVGLFDADSFFLYCDDVDYSWRVRLAGYKLVFHPAAIIFHDKRLDGSGRMVVSEAEEFYAAEAGLMMAWKYSREDLLAGYLNHFDVHGTPLQRKAAASYRERVRTDRLPAQLDADGVVAEFHDGMYAVHRW